MIEGRGLFYGETAPGGAMRIFSQSEWEAACAQASQWGMRYVHPKVMDWARLWYSEAGLTMLKDVAQAHHLTCYPYVYLKGGSYPQATSDALRATMIETEASMTAYLGHFFGGVLPDMEWEWNKQPAWATHFGEKLRALFNGVVIPTLYGDPMEQGGFPYPQILSWASAWMPMAYFAVWTNPNGSRMSAHDAAQWLHPQWETLNSHLESARIAPPPICPLIEVGNGLAPEEVTSWLKIWREVGYCGFWYDGVYAPYAEGVLSVPAPVWAVVSPAPAPAPTVVTPVITQTQQTVAAEAVPFKPAGSAIPGITETTASASLVQHLSESELRALFQMNATSDVSIPWNTAHAITRTWIYLMQFYPELALGSPRADEVVLHVNGEEIHSMAFDSGHKLDWFASSGRVALVGGPRGA